MSRHICARLAATVWLIVSAAQVYAVQEDPAIEHGLRVLELLRQEQFDAVTAEFNAQVAAALTAEQLGQIWMTLKSQVGEFESVTDRSVANVEGFTAVTLECQFERAALNMLVAFDGDDKIGGLRFLPAQAANAPPSEAPSSDGFTEEPFTVGSGQWALPATISLPSEGTSLPAVVLVHGSGPNDRDETIGPNKPFRDLAWGLAERGVAVLRYEKRTREYPTRFAQIQNFTVWEETVEDALLAVEALSAHSRIDAGRVFVLGHSLGGTLAPRIASEAPRLAGVVIMAGATRPLPELMVEQAEYIASLNPDAAADGTGLLELRKQAARMLDPDLPFDTPASQLLGVPASYWIDLNGYEPAELARNSELPMLILQGGRDYQVTLEDLKRWREALGDRPDVMIREYPELNHLFIKGDGRSRPSEYQSQGAVSDAVIDYIADWITAQP